MARQILVVFAQTTIQTEPTERTFYNPSTRQYLETFLVGRLLDYLKNPIGEGFEPDDQLTAIRPICPKQRKTGIFALQRRGGQAGALRIAYLSARYNYRQYQAQGIDNQVAFTAFD
jgi:hypothetical protein